MTIRMILVAFALSFAPGFALAEGGCRGMKAESQSAMTCLPGTSWDEEKGTCIASPTS